VVVVETDYSDRVGGYETWWDVPIAEVSENEAVQAAREAYVEAAKKERYFWPAKQGAEEKPAVGFHQDIAVAP
jgi:hypothetical protein